jgi:hypothetical protein
MTMYEQNTKHKNTYIDRLTHTKKQKKQKTKNFFYSKIGYINIYVIKLNKTTQYYNIVRQVNNE